MLQDSWLQRSSKIWSCKCTHIQSFFQCSLYLHQSINSLTNPSNIWHEQENYTIRLRRLSMQHFWLIFRKKPDQCWQQQSMRSLDMCQNYFIFPLSSPEMSRLKFFLSLILNFRSQITYELFLFIMSLFISVMRKTKLRPPWERNVLLQTAWISHNHKLMWMDRYFANLCSHSDTNTVQEYTSRPAVLPLIFFLS